ncbi:unnamed protein product [Cylicostephanus goldi]|uniref:Uncharacterized protein n=1 Tax=Cylicostephanus goldi TaxID=71465 RepID=A0A3P6SMY4_CYLGO|nr:unnamed protein product [Cylicostephanus goldi]
MNQQSPLYNTALINCPFTVIIYDSKKKMPVYFGRIVTPKLVEKATNVGESVKPKKGWCSLL